MVELADTSDSKPDVARRAGSSPALGTIWFVGRIVMHSMYDNGHTLNFEFMEQGSSAAYLYPTDLRTEGIFLPEWWTFIDKATVDL